MKNWLPITIFSFLASFGFLYAQDEQPQDTLFDEASKTFLVLPLLTNTPAMETGFGALPMYFFRMNQKDEVSPPSLASVYSLYTTNGSYIFTPMGRFFWDQDKNRAAVIFGTMRVNNDFVYDDLGNDLRLVYSEIRNFLTLEYSRKIVGDFYLGALYLGTQTNYKFDKGSEEDNEFAEEFFRQNGITDNFVSSLGLNFSFDNRDYQYYPTRGLQFSIRPKFNTEWLGSENEYVDTDYNFSYFLKVNPRIILAASISGGFATGDVPFDGYQVYGVRNSLRGYQAGKYKGENMIASQVELRWSAYKRWGAVVFAGIGSVWGNEENGEEEFERDRLPSAGLGVRYMVSKVKKINLRLDFAVGVDGNQGLHFGVMEAF